MSRGRLFGVAVILAMILAPQAAWGQKKSVRRKPAAPAPAPPPDLRPQAGEIAEQIRLLSRFLFVFGKVVNGLEAARDQSRRNQTTPAVEASFKQSRESLISSVNGLGSGIDELISSFRNDPNLQIQYLKLGAARDSVTDAAQLVANQQYDEAGTALTTAIERLTETIISMRLR